MRKKAEKKIREAAESLGRSNFYRIDRVRATSGMIRKVFDKTILDMARLETIELVSGDTSEMTESEIGNLIHQGDKLHVFFTFVGSRIKPDEKVPEKVDIVLKEIDLDVWRQFEDVCIKKENKGTNEKILEMIRHYIKNSQ